MTATINGLRLFLVISLGSFKKCYSEEHSAILLAKAGQDVAFQPLINNARNITNAPQFEEPARFDDLAITRIQVKTNDVVDRLWKNINNAQRFAIIKEKGAAKEVLKLYELLQIDILALERQNTKTKVSLSCQHDSCQIGYLLINYDNFN